MAVVFYPLGKESKFNNDEIRLSLRSIAKNAKNVKRVVIATVNPPEWLRNVEIIPIPDTLTHNKDGNLINKFRHSIEIADIHGTVIFGSDDHILIQQMDFDNLPTVFNNRSRDAFAKGEGKWRRRMLGTFDFLASRGVSIPCNYDSHTFQPYDADKVLEVLKGVDYETGNGFCINTLLKGLIGANGHTITQDAIKSTHESVESGKLPLNRTYAGYNDNGFSNGLRERLFEMFPDKCIYEA